MNGVLHWITEPLHYEFMQRALLEVVLMGAVTGLIGTYVVLRGLSFIGDALTHAVFPGIVLAFLFGQSIFLGALLFGILTSVLIAVLARSRRMKEDSAIGVLFAGAFALGVVLISATRNFARDLASFLFGNVLGVTREDIWASAVVGVIVVGLVVLFYRALLMTSFDRLGARAMNLPVFWLDLLLLVLVSLTVVVSLSAVGNILVLAMLVTPAAAARFLTNRLPVMMAVSAALGVVSGVVGLFISYHVSLAAGGMIVLVATGLFVLVWLFAPTHGVVASRVWARRHALEAEASARVVFESPEIRTPADR
jgi:manganese/iron transport system permease protein